MATVYTEYGPGEIVASETVRGLTRYRVAGVGYDVWLDETKVGGLTREGWAPMDTGNSVALPYDPRPQYDAIGTPGDDGSATIQPIHRIDPDERLSPANSVTFDNKGLDEGGINPGPNPELFAKSAGWQNSPDMGYSFDDGSGPQWGHPAAGPEPGESELHDQWMHENEGQAWEHESPHYQGEHPSQDYLDHQQLHQERSHGGVPTSAEYDAQYPAGSTDGGGFPNRPSEWDDSHLQQWGQGRQTYQGSTHEGIAIALPALAEGLAGAGGFGALARGALPAASGLLGGGAEQQQGPPPQGGDPNDPNRDSYLQQGVDSGHEVLDAVGPGPGWGSLIHSSRPAGLSDKYIDITADVDYYNDPVIQFRHDPIAFIERRGHVMDEGLNPRFASYVDMVEADENLRTAAWTDVRQKAMRLRREGKVEVKDIAPDRIYAAVEGDHGVYDVMIKKGGAFGGFGGGHAITNWHCSCEWGKWAFVRRYTYVGRLCSHGYASYLTMQSNHLRKPKTADALQNGPTRLTPELIINDTDDSQEFLDVTKDQRKDTGPDDVVSEKDIVHFAKVMADCENRRIAYPRELVAFLDRYADDQSPKDWKVEDASKAEPYLNEIRDFADRKLEDDYRSMDERNDKVRDAVEQAREHGTDADQFTARLRMAGPDQDNYADTAGGRRAPSPTPSSSGGKPIQRGPAGPPEVKPYEPNTAGGRFPGGLPGSPKGLDFDSAGGLGSPAGQVQDRTGPGNGVTPPASGGTPPASPASGGGWFGNGGGAAPGGTQPGQTAPGGIGNSAGGGLSSTPSGNSGSGGGNDGSWSSNGNTSQIGQGEYKIQSGDTLSDIAQRSGFGGNYQDLAKSNNIADPNKINAGDTINIPGGGNNGVGSVGGSAGADTSALTGGGVDTSAVGGNTGGGSSALGNPSGAGTSEAPVNAPPASGDTSGGASSGLGQSSGAGVLPTQKDSRRRVADIPPTATPTGQGTSANPAATPGVTPTSAPGSATTDISKPGAGIPPMGTTNPNGEGTQEGTSQVSGAGGSGDTSSSSIPGLEGFDMGGIGQIGDMIGQGAGMVGDIASGVGSAVGGIADGIGSVVNGIGGILGSVGDDDYNEWYRYAYPEAGDSRQKRHIPFNGSGNPGPLEIGTSEEYADKARKKAEDVTDLNGDITKPMEHKQGAVGIQRIGQEPNYVVPTVIREQRPTNGRGRQATAVPEDFDPLAPRTAASFENGYSEESTLSPLYIAANEDPVAAFQRSAAAGDIMSNNSSSDSGDIAGAARQFLQRTAGRNYSLAEQAELIREGDKGGAGNLSSLDLANTHYEAQNSVGLW